MFLRLPRALVGALLLSVVAHLVLLAGMPRDARFRLGGATADESRGRIDVRLQAAAAEARRTLPGRPDRAGDGAMSVRSAALRRVESPRAAATAPAAPETIAANPLSADTAEGVDADDMRTYRFNLALAARQAFSGIVSAGDKGRQGRVDVAVTLHGSRAPAEVVVHRSSGQPALDQDAVRMVTRAVALADLPRGMFGRDFRLVLPLLFGTTE
ncbi:TonB family protein [uncultured Propionivibrio sp.]|uniref:TonB family protein n=1 Tax=uncultured Propionivibrio sp. TaxID=426737 RepID=UPI0029C0595D|nr:TonB family protein [uncultured Propionivibrio sp.]